MTITKPSGGVQQTEKLMTGTEAVAQAVRLADVDVMAAYPIRPYDGVMQAVAKLIANGELDAEYIVAEGEHSQFEICKQMLLSRLVFEVPYLRHLGSDLRRIFLPAVP